MSLDWKQTEHGGFSASYAAYETPLGEAMARADVFDNRGLWQYETWIESDPYLKSAGSLDYVRVSYGTVHSMDEAKSVCEKNGVERAKGCLSTHEIAECYQKAFRILAQNAIYDWDMDIEEYIPVDDFRCQMRVLEGGYEPARIEVWMNDDLTIDFGHK